MSKIHFVALIIFLATGPLWGQIPQSISYSGRLATEAGRMDCNNAGTIQSFGPFIGQSNDVTPDTIFLCLGDSLFVNHANDEDLSGDPVPATPPGVGYAFYTCPPSVNGPTAAAIGNDPCVADMPPPAGEYYLYVGPNRTGDLPFFNGGQIQTFFNMGNPTLMWFAPVTFDALLLGPPLQGEYEGTPAGQCVNASIEEAFAIVYLNAINVTNLSVNGCGGTFTVSGGLPQWQNSATYTINIVLESDPNIRGEVRTMNVNHGDQVEFFVPQEGVYRIEVEDGKSCGGGIMANMTGCESVVFNFPFENALPGQNICVPVTVENALNLLSIQFTMTYDPSVLTYTGVQGFNPGMPNLNQSLNFGNIQPGVLTFSYDQLGIPFTVPNGETMYEVCFNVIGQIGTFSPLVFTGSPTAVEVVDSGGEIGAVFENGQINVSDKPLFIFLAADSLTCPSFDDGAITATIAQGTPPYRVEWNTVPVSGPNNGPLVIPQSGGTLTVNDLPAGVYQFIVTDSGTPGVVVRDTVEVFAGPDLGATLVLTSPTCNGFSDGTVEAVITLDGVVVNNPGSEYTFTWSVSPENTPLLSGRASGPYSVTVTDNSGCQVTASGNMSQPPRLRVLANNTFITAASCSGAMDGSIAITAVGGTTSSGNYFFQWSNGLGSVVANNSSVTNLNPGTYCVTITDDNGCVFEDCYNVGAVKTLSINAAISDVSCNGGNNGQIFITGATTGAPASTPYTFSWNTFTTPPVNTATTSLLNNLPVGSYSVTMTDASAAGCRAIDTFTVAQPTPLVVSLLDQSNETCTTGNDGQVIVGVTGGTGPYDYTWSHSTTEVDSIAGNLSAGMYTLTVTDANNCTSQLTASILAPTPPTIVTLDDDFVSCPESLDGALTVVAVPGASDIATYQWSNGMSGSMISGLAPGQYIVTVTDESFCTATDTALVLAPLPLTLDSFSLRLPDCPGFSNGQVTVFASGGTAPYTYTWSTNPGTPGPINPLPALAAGSYSVTVQDVNGCDPLIANVVLPDPPSITGSFSNIVGVTCPDDVTCNGRATFSAVYSDGSTGQFNFSWSSGETFTNVASSTATQLCRGAQSVTVSDGVCGVVFENLTIPSPADLTVGVAVDNVSCFGAEDGSISLTPGGGTAPYTYLWPATGEVTSSISNLGAGAYNAIVSDANGCDREQLVQVSEPDELILSVDPVLSTSFVSCSGDNDGVFAVSVNTGDNINPLGTAPFTWSGMIAPANSTVASNLAAGTYSVTVTDIQGCQDDVSFTIQEPLPIVFTLEPIEPPLCFGDATFLTIDTAYGGAGTAFVDFTFMVNNNGLSFPVNQPATIFAGDIIVTVEDPNGCTAETIVNVPQPPQIVVTLPDEVIVELGDSTVQLLPTITPGGNYDYLWTPATYLSSDTIRNPFVFPVGSLTYTLLVTNENGCTAEATVFVALDANRNVYIPNVFSPNDDGVNDDFRVFACRGVKSINFARLYDRWGGLVYESDSLLPSCLDGTKLWGGEKRGQELNPGVYVYMIEITFLDEVTLLYRGDVTIVR